MLQQADAVPAPEPPDSPGAWYAPDVCSQDEVHPGTVVTVSETGGGFAYDARLASSLAERLVAADGPLSVLANILAADAIENASGDRCLGGADCRIRLDGETVAARGDPSFPGEDAVTLPRRTANTTLHLDPPAGTRVTTVRANDRVMLHDPDGLDGSYDLSLPRYDTVTLALDANRDLGAEALTVDYRVETTTKAVLAVTVDA